MYVILVYGMYSMCVCGGVGVGGMLGGNRCGCEKVNISIFIYGI